jgi:large subunit ribosomal protein L35Ae
LSRHRQKANQMVIRVEGIETRDKAKQLVGKKVLFKTEGSKEILGKVASPHGNKGAIRAIFEKGMPGQALTKTVEIN